MTRLTSVCLLAALLIVACAAPPPTPTFDDRLAAGRTALDSGDAAKAITELEAAVAINPTRAEAQVLLGKAYYVSGRRDDARSRLQVGLQQDPNNAEAQYLLGDLSADAKQPLAAAVAYSAAIKLDPNSRSAHPNIDQVIDPTLKAGKDAASAGNSDQAVKLLEAVSILQPDSIEARFALGNLHANLGRFDAAQAAYEAVLRINPKYSPALTNLGVMAYQRADSRQGD